jgi:hypothetical protein
MDELAVNRGLDPIDLCPQRIRRLPRKRQTGAERFGGNSRNPASQSSSDSKWLVGTDVASAV